MEHVLIYCYIDLLLLLRGVKSKKLTNKTETNTFLSNLIAQQIIHMKTRLNMVKQN